MSNCLWSGEYCEHVQCEVIGEGFVLGGLHWQCVGDVQDEGRADAQLWEEFAETACAHAREFLVASYGSHFFSSSLKNTHIKIVRPFPKRTAKVMNENSSQF